MKYLKQYEEFGYANVDTKGFYVKKTEDGANWGVYTQDILDPDADAFCYYTSSLESDAKREAKRMNGTAKVGADTD